MHVVRSYLFQKDPLEAHIFVSHYNFHKVVEGGGGGYCSVSGVRIEKGTMENLMKDSCKHLKSDEKQ